MLMYNDHAALSLSEMPYSNPGGHMPHKSGALPSVVDPDPHGSGIIVPDPDLAKSERAYKTVNSGLFVLWDCSTVV